MTSAALLGWAVQVLAARDPALLPPDADARGWLGAARADAAAKRRLLEYALARGGPAAILDIGATLEAAPAIPALQVLLGASDTAALAGRWMRLESYYHSHHRTRIEAGPGRWLCVRGGSAGREPGDAENLLICSVLAGLLRRFGCTGVDATMGERPILSPPPQRCPRPTAAWTLLWRGAPLGEARRAPPDPSPGDSPAPADAASLVRRLLLADVSRGWTVAEVARRLARSPRSLQRDLAADGHSFSSLVRAARVETASTMLLAGDWGLADVGFAAGFADQAHFQREFRRVAGMTPADYRRQARS